MARMERLTTADGRDVWFLGAADADEFVAGYDVPGERHRLLLAWDADGLPAGRVRGPIAHALDQRCVLFAAWGTGCERTHDICDETFLHRIERGLSQPEVMTTWCAHEPLADALFELLDVCQPFDEWAESSETWVVATIGDTRLIERVRSGVEAFESRSVCGDAAVRLLASNPAVALTVARWFVDEWPDHHTGRTREEIATDFLPEPGDDLPLVLVASIDDQPVGTIALRGPWDAAPHIAPPWIGGLYILPEFRGRGFGSQLVECAVAAARKLECGEVHAAVRDDVASYLRKAWEVVGEVEADDGPVTVIRRETRKNQARGAP